MTDLTVDSLVAIHDRIMAENGGDNRILSEANLHQLIFRANLITEIVPRAAFVFYSLCAYPPFREGNTGTALAATELVLASGGYRITGEKARIKTLAEGILAFTIEHEDIGQWFWDNVQKT